MPPDHPPSRHRSSTGRGTTSPRELPFHKLVDWDATAGRFTYDLAYADKQPDWTYSPWPALPLTGGVAISNVPSSWLDPWWSLTRLLPERPFKQVLVDLGVE
jgi:hypothetical protein